MKIRKGFVSNSSTSNFVILIKDDNLFPYKYADFVINKEDIGKLEEYGFKPSYDVSPFDNRDGRIDLEEFVSMKYSVVCNQDEVIEFLVKNNIPFKASIHYDHKYMSYKKDSDYIFQATNYGLIANRYGEDHYKYLTKKDMKKLEFKPYLKIPKEEYL